ncbi:head GIN domain-containing protein [Chitinophaga sp. CB10]|uniref:head GIN domain-containing protein n=1 Tax=Chitinophaga sp. CB10 TaxID=1891659 RepID=UPI0025BADA15|nr:head GIN domain-containing protein [Chitinophaga sp. CB10]
MRINTSLCHGLLTLTTLVLLTSCNFRRIKGNGNVIKEERQITAFRTLKVRDGMNVHIQQGEIKPAVIEAESNIVPLIELVRDGEELIVRLRDDVNNVSTHGKFDVYLSSPELDAIRVEGSGDIDVEGTLTNRESIRLRVTGSGQLSGKVDAPVVDAAIAGAGDMKVSGQTRDLKVSISGVGNFNGLDLLTENTKVNISGTGSAQVHASVTLKANITGTGDISYKGSPQVTQSITGAGGIKQIK